MPQNSRNLGRLFPKLHGRRANQQRAAFGGGLGCFGSSVNTFTNHILKNFGGTTSGAFALTCIKLLAVALLLAAAPKAWADLFFYRFASFRGLYEIGYSIIFWAAILGFVIIPFLRNAYTRILLVLIVIVGYAADQMFMGFTDYHLNLGALQTVWWERATALEAFSTYAIHFARDCLWVFGVGIILALEPARNWALKLRWSAVPLSALVLVSYVIFHSKGGTQEFPPPFALPIMFGITATASPVIAAAEEIDSPGEVQYDRPIEPLAKHIVLIVDESVRGDAMGINQPGINNTPFLSNQEHGVINFGVAVAGSNCSQAARTMIRFGLRPADFQDSDLNRSTRPPIWTYARRAGYRTILLDAFEALENFQSDPVYATERTSIDRFLSRVDTPSYIRDHLIAERLIQLLKEDAPSFILVNKFGTHFPYEYAYPPELDRFPVPLQNRTLAYLLNYREALLNAYKNAILWSVDGFFQRLLGRFDDSRVLLIYTSDHGQSLMDGGRKQTHCTTTTQNTQVGEGLVPLVAVTGIRELGTRLRESAARAYGHATHFEIFPTSLLAMGYDEQWVRTHYGPSLLDLPGTDKRQFLVQTSSGVMRFDPRRMKSVFEGAKWFPVD
jgi:glucan phosphoethanolaminetransferase (alkaline phosphatase superfamily)